MWKVVIEDDEGKRTVVPLTRSEYTIGRRDGSSIRLTERNVSRSHARLYKKDGNESGDDSKFIVEDLTSYNGVFVNGLRLAHAQPVEHGDLVQIGDYRIVLHREAVGASPQASTASTKDTDPAFHGARASTLLDRPNRLVMLQGPAPGAEFPLDKERLTVGRAEDADISIHHNSVSRLHCEIHALGDCRFEIVDKGSSNGVRVNGADLERGILDPGDTIELGDVELRLVGAGQVFRPDTQRLSTIADRAVSVSGRPPRVANVLPVAVFAVVALAGAAGAWAYTRPRLRAPAPQSSLPARSREQTALEEAKSLCTKDDCDAAHGKLLAEIGDGSRWRDSQDFKDIESQWAQVLLDRAAAAADPAAKRALYQRVAETPTVDALHRKVAADRLQDLDSSGNAAATDPMDLPSAPGVVVAKNRVDDTAARAEPSRKAAPPDPVAPVPTPTAAPARAAPGSVEERERLLALSGTPDAKLQLRQQLEPRVYAGRASEAEVRLLISTCKELGDKPCVVQARTILKQVQASSQ